jgi:hypothetical protein
MDAHTREDLDAVKRQLDELRKQVMELTDIVKTLVLGLQKGLR